jgi:bifunctional non-homologous end joining protein LigD
MTLSHPERVLYPEAKITKQDLADYYESIQDWILPYLIKRPLTLVRCPGGWDQQCFFQKHLTDNKSKNLFPVEVKEKSGTTEYSYIKNIQGVIDLVQISTLEIHAWGCHVNQLEKPDVIIFDLDPADDVPWKKVIAAAKLIREKLNALQLKSFVKTTGGKGLHVVVPIKPKYGWEEIKNFSHVIVNNIVEENPDDFIGNMNKAKRKGKIFLDYLRNGRGATAVAPYSTRARKNAPVSTPLSWEELTTKIKPNTFTVKNLMKRLNSLKQDPWEEFYKLKQDLKFK